MLFNLKNDGGILQVVSFPVKKFFLPFLLHSKFKTHHSNVPPFSLTSKYKHAEFDSQFLTLFQARLYLQACSVTSNSKSNTLLIPCMPLNTLFFTVLVVF